MCFVYQMFCRILVLLALRGRRDRSKDVEILVLRKQVEVLRLWGANTQISVLICWFATRADEPVGCESLDRVAM